MAEAGVHDTVGGRTWVGIVATHAERGPDRAALRFEGEELTYGELAAAAAGVAAGLAERGAGAGDGIGLWLDTSTAFPVALLGAHSLGLVVSPVSTRLSDAEVERQLEHAGARFVIVDAPRVDLARRWAERSGATVIDAGQLAGFRARGGVLDATAIGADDVATLMYTSGTTAHPKGVILSHGNYVYNSEVLKRLYAYGPDDIGLSYFPLYHMNGHNYQLVTWLCAGACVHLQSRFSASGFGRQLVETGATICSVNSTHVKMILAHPETPDDARNSLRMAKFGMSLDGKRIAEFERRFGVQLCGSYSQTEAIAPVVFNPTEGLRKPEALGLPVLGYTLRIVGEDGKPSPDGTIGEIQVACASRHGISPGYFKDEAASEDLRVDGWWRTLDLGSFDADGFLHYQGRIKDMIKRSGFNVAAAEVERVLEQHPEVELAAAVGVPDEMHEEAIKALIVRRAGAGLDEKTLNAHCERELADYKVPSEYDFVDDLPKTAAGKVDKRAVKELVGL
jgi:crotonobetaine/carnitine-CoA ligase